MPERENSDLSYWSSAQLEARLGRENWKLENRRYVESSPLRRFRDYMHWVELAIRFSGMSGVCRRAFLNPVVENTRLELEGLPVEFESLRILHLSDLHFDLDERLFDEVAARVDELEFDLCLATGDYRDHIGARGRRGVALCAELFTRIDAPVYACLGNHDRAEDAAVLEDAGVTMLINGSAYYEKDGARLYLAGVDDGDYGKELVDFDAAYSGIPSGACSVVLCHNPSSWKDGVGHGASLMLSGHTHGGQVCLPNGFAPLTHSSCPRALVAGKWKMGSMTGYTSRGAGGSGVPARLFCPGEIAVHTLCSASS